MPIPTYEQIALPLLKLGLDGADHRLRDAIEMLADDFRSTLEEQTELLPSGQQAKFDNRVGWARTALRKAGLFDAPKRAFFRITDRGRDVALSGIPGINDKYFLQFAEHREYRGLNDKIVADSALPASSPEKAVEAETPRERLESAYTELTRFQARDLLDV